MAGDWIKMRADLATSPKVVRMASALKADRLRIVGGLHSAWCLFDSHTESGLLEGYTAQTVDDLIGWPGFSDAMIAVGWMCETSQGIEIPRFTEHNGKSAKRRCMDSERKRAGRLSASEADELRTREEKRREDINQKPLSPTSPATGDDRTKKKSEKFDPLKACPENVSPEVWADWVSCRKAQRKPLSESTCKAQARQLKDHPNPDQVIIDSISAGWQGLFPDRISNVTPIRNGKQARPPLKPGEFYDVDWDDKNPSTHKIRHVDTHDPTTGYAWAWLKKQTWYKP